MFVAMASRTAFAGLLAVVGTSLASGPALANKAGYCDAYARDVANSKAGVGDVLTGTIGGALGGAIIGAIIDKGEGAGKGALIGGMTGTAVGIAATDAKWQKAYRRAYDGCMNSYTVATSAESSGKPKPAQADTKPKRILLSSAKAPRPQAGKPQRGTEAWHDYCDRKYRSYDRDTGMYKSYSGKMSVCK